MKHLFSPCLLLLGVTALFAQDSVDRKISADFNVYLSGILSSESDNKAIIDSSLNYRFVFKTSLPLLYPSDLEPKHFAESAFLICTANPEVPSASNFQVNDLITDTRYVDQTYSHSSEKKDLYYSTFEKSPRYADIRFGEPMICKANYTHVFSFNAGRHLILCERWFGPDIRSSMPPGLSVTYFLERID